MARYDDLKQIVTSNIYQNTAGAITGTVLQNVLTALVQSLGNDSSFKGILSTTNKPTGNVDQKQWYLGYTSGSSLSLNLTAVGLGTLVISNTTLYIVYNDDSGWHANNLFGGIASILESVSDINTFKDRFDAEQKSIYQSCGVGLCAFTNYEDSLPDISESGCILTPDGSIVSTNETITLGAGDIIWVLPKNVNNIIADVADLFDYFNLFIPAGSVNYDYLAGLEYGGSWKKVGVEVFGISEDTIDVFNNNSTYVYGCKPMLDYYTSINSFTECADRGEIIDYLKA